VSVKVEYKAHCTKCDWTATGEKADKAAEKHTNTEGHATISSANPAEVES
jgi:hypothetical protein